MKVKDQGSLQGITGKDGCEYEFWEQVEKQSIQKIEGNSHRYQFDMLESLNVDNEEMTTEIPRYINAEVKEERILENGMFLNEERIVMTRKKKNFEPTLKQVKRKKKKANCTSIHEEFTRYKYISEGGQERIGSKCNDCGYQMRDINPTNLKLHYQRKHPLTYEKVIGKRSCYNF